MSHKKKSSATKALLACREAILFDFVTLRPRKWELNLLAKIDIALEEAGIDTSDFDTLPEYP